MIEKILEKVVNEMAPHLELGQQEHLKNVLYVNFHGLEVQKECTELAATGQDGDEVKIKMFIASKKAVNRQDNTRAFNSYIAEKVSIGRILPMFFCQFCVFYI